MDYIDWIISSVLFITVIAFVLISLFNILPKSNNTNTISDLLYKSTISLIIPVYNVSMISEDSEVYPYVISDCNYGRAENTFEIDTNNNLLFGLIYDKDKFYNYETDINALSGLGVRLLLENFNDYNYQDTFDLNSGTANISSGILELEAGSTIDTTIEFSKYLGSFVTNAEDINVYINFDTTSDRFYCSFNETGVQLFKIGESEAIEENNTTLKTTNWRKLNFGYYRDFEGFSWFFCGIGENINILETSSQTHPEETTIRIEAIDDQTYIDDFRVYKSLINITEHDGTTVKTDSLRTTVTSTDMRVEFYELSEMDANEVLGCALSFSTSSGNLNNYNEGPIKIFSNDSNQNKLVFFPIAKEFWIYKYTGEDPITITYIVDEIKPYNFGSATENGQFVDLNKMPGSYAVPVSFVPENSFTTENFGSFDVNFNKVFSEITPTGGGSETPIIQYCKVEGCSDITSDSNFIFDTDTNTAEVIFKFPEETVANQPFNIVIIFNYFNLENLENATGEATVLDGTQLTARVSAEEIIIDTNQFYLYNIFNPIYPNIKQTIIFDVFDNTGLHAQDCNFFINWGSQNIVVTCDENYLLKVRYRFTDLNNTILDYPNLSITKTNERIVTQEHFENLSCDSYFVNIKNKTLDVNCGIGVNPNYKMIIKYLHNTGLLENADIYIK
jgi:hypothetical protein